MASMSMSSGYQSNRAASRSRVVRELAAIDQNIKLSKVQRVNLPWIQTTQAHTIFGIAILVNAIFIGVDVEVGQDGFNWGLWAIESTFLVIFSVEIVLRVRAERPKIWRFFDRWGIFDLAVTLIGCIDAWVFSLILGGSSNGENSLSTFSVLRIFRLVRLVRLVRVLRMFRELVVVVQTIGASIMAVAWMSLLLFLIMYTGAIATVLLIGQPYKAEDPAIDRYFGSLGSALFSHFCVVTLESWPDIAQTAMRCNKLWGIYFVGLVVFTNFGLVNLMVGVIVQRIITLSRDQENELASFAAESEQFRSTLHTLFDSAAINFNHEVTSEEIRGLLKRGETHEIMSAFGINLNIPEATLHTIMDLDRSGTTTFQEFFDACIRLCGSQQSLHSVFVQHDICKCRQDLDERMGRMEQMLNPLEPRESQASPSGSLEANVIQMLERMDRLGHAQEAMLADLAAVREHAERSQRDDPPTEGRRGTPQSGGLIGGLGSLREGNPSNAGCSSSTLGDGLTGQRAPRRPTGSSGPCRTERPQVGTVVGI